MMRVLFIPMHKEEEMAVKVVEAFQEPLSDPSWQNKILIGGLLCLLPIVNFFALGYSLKYLAGLLNEDNRKLPEWDQWGDYFLIGLKFVIVTFVYLLGVAVIGKLAMFFSIVLGIMLAFLVFLATMFVLPTATVIFAQSGFNIGAAIDVKKAFEMSMQNLNEYMVVYVLLVGCTLILGTIAGIPLLGWILMAFGMFYVLLSSSILLASVFSSAQSSVPPPPPQPED